jgi:NAD(P)-dependent dehydrogenase (short-subunit alcohol dehydrogenase family)
MAVNSFTIMLASKLRNTKFRVNSVTQGYAATDLNDSKEQNQFRKALNLL